MSDGTSTKPREYETVGQIIADRDRLRSRLREAEALLREASKAMTNCRRPEYDDSDVQARMSAFLASGTEK